MSCCKDFMATSLEDLRSSFFWRGLLAETLGTAFLVLIGCGSCLGSEWDTFSPSVVQISLTFGLAVATVVWCVAHISGGHVNPAVTIGMLTTRKISVVRGLLYVFCQCSGALMGAAMLKGLTPVQHQGNLGLTTIHSSLTVEQAFGVEFMITFLLVFTVFSCCDSKRSDLSGSAPLTIGLCVTLCHLFAVKYTGSSMNPARTFGPAIITAHWEHHWVYWCGPVIGGVMAALIYDLIFAEDASFTKVKYYLLTKRSTSDERFDVYSKDEKEQEKILEIEEHV